MADQKSALKLIIPKGFPQGWKRQAHNYYCHSSSGLGKCECSQKDCRLIGRPVEPLAFYLPPFTDVNQQKQCPLYSVIPKEIRDLIFEFALSDDGVPSFNEDNGDRTKPDIACALLQSCKAVYLETYRLPMLLNGYLSYTMSYGFSPRPTLARLSPWQYALIQRLDFGLQQISLEDGSLLQEIMSFNPAIRNSGAYVAPCFYQDSNPNLHTNGVIPSHEFGLTTFGGDTPGWHPEDGDTVTLREACYLRDTYKKLKSHLQAGFDFTARSMVARPLTRLTIRMSRTDWWTWTDDPNTTNDEEQLALDPACGRSTRPLLSDMLKLAEQRRNGEHPQYQTGEQEENWAWGAAISMLPDLRTLELVLETYLEKRKQLEVVVDCAKTWKFPLKNTQYELACDGKVDVLAWSSANDADSGWVTESGSETADMDLDDAEDSDRVGVPTDDVETTGGGIDRVENEDEEMEDSTSEPQPNQDSAAINGRFSPLENLNIGHTTCDSQAHTGPTSPSYFEPSASGRPLSPYPDSLPSGGYTQCSAAPSPTSSVFTPQSPEYLIESPSYYPISPSWHSETDWYNFATEYEVRVVRYRRARVNLEQEGTSGL